MFLKPKVLRRQGARHEKSIKSSWRPNTKLAVLLFISVVSLDLIVDESKSFMDLRSPELEAQPTNRDRRSAASIELPASRHQPSLRDEPSERLPLDEPDEEPAESEQEEPAAGHGRHQLPPTELTAAAAAAGPQRLNSNSLANRLRIIRLFAPEAIRNGTQNATLDCMFRFDKKLDQRLTIKWFLNDELEPIYQWIPELNKRVYSDKYERFIDKSYELADDVEFLLQAYRQLTGSSPEQQPTELASQANEPTALQPDDPDRKLLAQRLNKLAKLGGQHSRQLLDTLRASLGLLDREELLANRFRALRLVRPSTELAGRFTCSVSSLDGDDLRSTRLVVYEPAKNFSFQVNKAPNNQYNLSCRADQMFPRPSLALYRFRAGPLASSDQQQHAARATRLSSLAAASLRQEPLQNAQSRLFLQSPVAETDPFLTQDQPLVGYEPGSNELAYGIATHALLDESSLSSNVVSQFECVLTLEGTNYELRQSLALQRGWHVNSAALTSRSTLLGLFSALASLLCLMLALVSSMLIFKLLKRHAKNKIHQRAADDDDDDKEAAGLGESNTDCSTTGAASNSNESPANNQETFRGSYAATVANAATDQATTSRDNHYDNLQSFSSQQPYLAASNTMASNVPDSDGVYRVPGNTFTNGNVVEAAGTRFIIGPRSGQYYNALHNSGNLNRHNSLQI